MENVQRSREAFEPQLTVDDLTAFAAIENPAIATLTVVVQHDVTRDVAHCPSYESLIRWDILHSLPLVAIRFCSAEISQ
jgi:hypothetical protein